MRYLTAASLALALASCATPATGGRPPPVPVATDADPQVEPRVVGTFPLPEALAKDPTRVAIPPLDFEVVKPQKVQLSNGLTVYLQPDRTTPLINAVAMVKAGSMDEPADKLGVATLTFDLMTNAGAGERDADAVDALLDFRAANAGGGAGDELSSLGINMRSEDVEVLLPVFADMLLRPRFQKERFDVTLGRYVESVRRRPDSVEGLAGRALAKAVHGPQSPFGRETTEPILRKLKVEDLRAFHQRFISPANTVLVVTGDFEPAQMRERLERLFGGWKAPARPERQLPPPSKLERRVILVPKETAQAKIRIGAHGYQRLSPLEYPSRVMNTALGGGLGAGRLYREIRDQKGLAYSAYSSVSPGPVTGLFMVGVDTKPETAGAAIEAALDALEDVEGRRPLRPEEVARAADMYLNSFAFRFDSPEKIAREKAVYDFFGYPDDYLETYRENIARVDPKAAEAAARQLIDQTALQIVVVGPPEKMGDLSRFGPVTVIRDVEAFR
jgi:zinc protease